MTQEWIDQFNKKCAEFMNYELITPDKRKHPDEWKHSYWEHKDKANVHTSKKVLGRDGYLSFHSDWNRIMEVVEKIQTLNKLGGIVLIQQGRCKITSRMAGDNSIYADVSLYFEKGVKGQKEAVVQAIDQFIDWYNKQKES